MKRYHRIHRDANGNLVAGASAMVYAAFGGQTVTSTVYPASGVATPTTSTSLPIVSGSDGVVTFAVPLGTYDIVTTVPGVGTVYEYGWEAFDYKDAALSGTVNSIGLAMPTQFAVTNSPLVAAGTLNVAWNAQVANTVLCGPAAGADAAPTFRAFVAADINGVAVDLTTNQAAIAGDKTFSGNCAFSASLATTGIINTGGFTTSASATISVNIVQGIAGLYKLSSGDGWGSVAFPLDSALSTVAPTKVAVKGTVQGWSHSAAAMNDLGTYIEIPQDYAEGVTGFYPYVHWTTVGVNNGTVRHGLEYTIVTPGSAMAAATTIYVEAAAAGVAYTEYLSEFPSITTAVEPGSILLCRLLRDAAHANDTCTDASVNLAFGIHYKKNRFSTKNRVNPFYT